MRAYTLVVCLAAVAVVSGCDDDTTSPEDTTFSVTFNVTDLQGDLVAGVRVASMPVVPASYWLPPEGGTTTPATNVVSYSLDAPMPVRVEVRDVAGSIVRLLVDGEQAAGVHSVLWDGRDGAGQSLPGGWYAFHVEFDDQTSETPCILAVCDPEWHSLGMTDGAGRLVINDFTMVPAFWTPDPVGDVTLTNETLLRLEDATGAGMYATFTASVGPQTVDVTWTPEPAAFAIDLTILQEDGVTPVAGARIGGMPAVPEWAYAGKRSRSSVNIPLELQLVSTVHLTVQDVTGQTIRTLVDGAMPAGSHEVTWVGDDDIGATTPPGWYQVRFLADADGEPAVADSAGIIQITYETDSYIWGITDEQGRVRLSDRRLVPGLRDLPPVTATNEDGDIIGTVALTTRTWLFVEDAGWVVLDDLIDGWQRVTATVQPYPISDDTAGRCRGEDDPPPPGPTRLLPPYPNPFN